MDELCQQIKEAGCEQWILKQFRVVAEWQYKPKEYLVSNLVESVDVGSVLLYYSEVLPGDGFEVEGVLVGDAGVSPPSTPPFQSLLSLPLQLLSSLLFRCLFG